MSTRAHDILPLHPAQETVADIRVGRLLAYLGDHRCIVDTHQGGGPLVARCLASMDGDALAQGAAIGARVNLAFENGDPASPIVMEFSDEDAQSDAADANAPDATILRRQRITEMNLRAANLPKRLRVEAGEELVLECGRASITLLRDGRVVIKGAYVETCATGTNRIKGGQVRIN